MSLVFCIFTDVFLYDIILVGLKPAELGLGLALGLGLESVELGLGLKLGLKLGLGLILLCVSNE